MNASVPMLLSFVLGLLVLYQGSVVESLGVNFAVYILLIIAVVPVVGYRVWCMRSSWHKGGRLVDRERLKAKYVALVAGLMLMLVYSSLMSQFGLVPIDGFVSDYLLSLPVLLLLLPSYVRWVDQRAMQSEDEVFRFGLVLLRKKRWIWAEQKMLVLSWVVKILFLPLMYSGLVAAVSAVLLFDWELQSGSVIAGLFVLGVAFDLLIGVCGYIFSSRLFDSEVLGIDDSWMGWLVCLICYPPLVFLLHIVREQSDKFVWTDWLLPDEPFYWVWAVIISGSWGGYWVSTACFGLRFSNLSWRGLVANGPYRYVKHPAYLAKNIYWWAHTVPLYGVFGVDALRNLLGLIFVSLVYYLRAKTEERHLLCHPEYAAYAQWIEQHGLFARLRRGLWGLWGLWARNPGV